MFVLCIISLCHLNFSDRYCSSGEPGKPGEGDLLRVMGDVALLVEDLDPR